MFLRLDHVLRCDKPLCHTRFEPPGYEKLGKGEALYLARLEGWHVTPCGCSWRHKEGHLAYDYCPEHYPLEPRPIENLPSL